MHWKTVDKKKEPVDINTVIRTEPFYKWMFSQPIKRTLAGRNDRGRNVMYLRGRWAGGIHRRRKIIAMFKKGWYAHEQQMD